MFVCLSDQFSIEHVTDQRASQANELIAFWEFEIHSSTVHSRDGLNHGEAHHDGTGGMVLPVVWQPANTVVTVSEDLDSQLVIFLKRRLGF